VSFLPLDFIALIIITFNTVSTIL